MCQYKKNQPLICFDKRICKTCKVEKDLSVLNFELRSSVTGRMSLECRPCYRVKVNTRLSKPEAKERLRYHRVKLSEWYKAYHKRPEVKEKAKQLRQNPEHKALRLHLGRKREIAKIHRTPPWADMEAIKQFYKNCPPGMTVDHIIPLQGKTVSGFHTIDNLQYLTRSENCSKRNKF